MRWAPPHAPRRGSSYDRRACASCSRTSSSRHPTDNAPSTVAQIHASPECAVLPPAPTDVLGSQNGHANAVAKAFKEAGFEYIQDQNAEFKDGYFPIPASIAKEELNKVL